MKTLWVLLQGAGQILPFIERFADAGLVFLVMAIVIVYLYRAYKAEKRRGDAVSIEYQNYLKESQKKNLEMMMKISEALNTITQNLFEIKGKLK